MLIDVSVPNFGDSFYIDNIPLKQVMYLCVSVPNFGDSFYLELSSQVQRYIEENLIGRFPTEAFAGSSI